MAKTKHQFGKYAVIRPITYHFEKEPDWYWIFKPPTTRDELDLQKFMFQKRTHRTASGVEELPATFMEVVMRQLALTFDGTNIPKYEEIDGELQETGKPILDKDASTEEVEAVLGEMPTDLTQELWKALGEHVPNWGAETNNPKA